MKQKQTFYVAPATEVIEVLNEGVMAASITEMPNEPWPTASPGNNNSKGSSLSELEDLINDILTY